MFSIVLEIIYAIFDSLFVKSESHVFFFFIMLNSCSRTCTKSNLHVPLFLCLFYFVTNVNRALFSLFYDSYSDKLFFFFWLHLFDLSNGWTTWATTPSFDRIQMIYVMVLESRCFDAKWISYTHFSKPTAFYPSAEFGYINYVAAPIWLTKQSLIYFIFLFLW